MTITILIENLFDGNALRGEITLFDIKHKHLRPRPDIPVHVHYSPKVTAHST